MTLSELKQHTLWADCTPSQRKFVLAYLECHGDKLAAGKKVWNAKTDAITKDMVNRSLRHPRIRKLLAYWHGAEVGDAIWPMTKRELADLIARRLRLAGITNAVFSKLVDQFTYLRGWTPAPLTNPHAKPSGDSIDSMVLAMERAKRDED